MDPKRLQILREIVSERISQGYISITLPCADIRELCEAVSVAFPVPPEGFRVLSDVEAKALTPEALKACLWSAKGKGQDNFTEVARYYGSDYPSWSREFWYAVKA